MRDKTTASFISGLIASVFMNIIDWTAFLLGYHKERLLDWAAIIVYGYLPTSIAHTVLAQLGQLFFSSFLGIIYYLFLAKLSDENHILKGWIFAIITWFGLYGISISVGLPELKAHTFNTTFSHFISASIYGVTLAHTFKKITR
ncbi:DUF6789 family protein [Natranaerobius trueperi]|uniref:DUF1440 domain-containing protein n=1 Tax=Natranaerobius trueperi TaxID=759412 RepID=A0A226C182_9FIRM|nr:DUF6789 family protein [Natranaerobius trueperi]OWZ84976.1 hypothetical protein CDO51_00810 [Natranaerobius trueperi]